LGAFGEAPARRQVKQRGKAQKNMEDDPFVWDGFDQGNELARLRHWLTKVESRPRRERLCRAISELIQDDLLRYGLCRGWMGFGIIGEWAAIEAWAHGIFYPSDPAGWGIIHGLCNPRLVLVEAGYAKGQADLIFLSLLRGNGPNAACRHRGS
jgi:hypothetical protein